MAELKLNSESNSQAGKESFVISMLDNKIAGTYIEIGGYAGIDISNTFLLEKKYNWSGVALEIDQGRSDIYKSERNNPVITSDATTFDWKSYLEKNSFPKQIDYLQVDIEPAKNTYKALRNMPFHEYRFSTITFEHDRYAHRFNWVIQMKAHKLLTSHGYRRIALNVCNDGNPFEDWYIDPTVSTLADVKSTFQPNCNWSDLFQ